VLGFGSALTVCSVASCDARAFESFKVALEFGSVFAPARLWAAQSKLDGTLDSGSALANAKFGGTVCSVCSHCRIGILAIVGLRFVLDQPMLMQDFAAQSAGLFLCHVSV
jgi:hypothetical protein